MKKRPEKWKCIKECGACCRLDPNERNEALMALSKEQRKIYLSMVGKDGWCIHFDSDARNCRIYENRPDFCRVDNLAKLFNVKVGEEGHFASKCCNDQIKSIYGPRSKEIKRFKRNIQLLSKIND